MKSLLCYCISSALAVLALATPVRSAPPTVADFLRRHDINNAQISEDGRYVSFLTPSATDYYDFNTYDTETKESKKYDLKGQEVLNYYWIDSNRVGLVTQHRPAYWYRQQVFDVKQAKITGNLTYKNDKGWLGWAEGVPTIISSLRRDPNLFMAWFHDFDGGQPGLAVISLKLQPRISSSADNSRYSVKEWVDIPNGEFHGASTDKDGEVRIISLYRDHKMTFHHRANSKSPWKPLPLDFETTTIIGFDNDPDYLFVAHYSDQAVSSRLHRYRISTGEFGAPLFEDPEYSMSKAHLKTVRQADGTLRVLALSYERDVYVQRAIDPEFARLQAAVNAKLPGRINTLVDVDRSLRKTIVSSETSREPARLLLYDHSNGNLMPLPAPTPWLNPAEMSMMRPIKFQSRDGLTLEGYLSLPIKPAGGGKPPLIVFPHGGPWVRESWGYDAVTQLFTSRGYAVFQPNYRGSTGYSKAVSKDFEFDFRKMHDDVTDGTRHLIAQNLVDPQRIAIYGASFGGYLAISGAAFEPDLYRCAVTFAGVFDWKQMIRQHWSNSHDNKFNYEYLLKKLGDPATQEERFENNSPINHVTAIKVPVFVIHGKRDSTVDYRQSTKLLSELERNKIKHEKLFFPTEVHGFIEKENQIKFLEAIDRFLAQNL